MPEEYINNTGLEVGDVYYCISEDKFYQVTELNKVDIPTVDHNEYWETEDIIEIGVFTIENIKRDIWRTLVDYKIRKATVDEHDRFYLERYKYD